jgi:hypothetical protein
MKRVEVCEWMLLNEATGKRKRSRWKMTKDDALARDPGATPCPGSQEVRDIAETEDEKYAALYRLPKKAD